LLLFCLLSGLLLNARPVFAQRAPEGKPDGEERDDDCDDDPSVTVLALSPGTSFYR
jgi:hypothetical protein